MSNNKDDKFTDPNMPEWKRLGIKMPTVKSDILHSVKTIPSTIPSTIPAIPKFDKNKFVFPDTCSSVDGQVIDEPELSAFTHPISGTIDNNDFVDHGAFNTPILDNQPNIKVIPQMADQSEEYILLVRGKVVLKGPKVVVEKTIRSILYGENQDYTDVRVEDLILLKNVKIKAGIFIED